ncbi:hypothetical protein SCP_0214530 [Sparassis crispa]|uniref:Uncharacterized protein n=1 Tax=Sparassis crispa TaxID=139825 RepID=A0A401GDJ4_9APHY|nr:hypothetical protein SCP_0214530 [Sparassis crispa]GBE80242.1 hypothetical protein SCP_0214530 [Sparassis crispa]
MAYYIPLVPPRDCIYNNGNLQLHSVHRDEFVTSIALTEWDEGVNVKGYGRSRTYASARDGRHKRTRAPPASCVRRVEHPFPAILHLALDPRGEPCGLLRGASTLAPSVPPVRGAPKVEYDTAEADLS